MEPPHKVLHVELVSTAGALPFLFGEPDFFFGNVGEMLDDGGQAHRGWSGEVN
jgi:hypothetical protein